MGQTIRATRTQTNAPISLYVGRDGGIDGLTVEIKIVNGDDVSQFLDFNDGTFKDAGHTTPTLALTEASAADMPGLYAVDGGFDLSAITIPAAASSLLVYYAITAGGESGNDVDTIQFDDALEAVLADTAAIEPLVSTNLDAQVSLVETEAAAAAREVTNTAEHAATLAAVGLVETEASAATREATNTAEHAATLAAVGALAFATPADVLASQAAIIAQGDAAWITAVGFETEASAATREATNTAEHAATLAAIGALPTPGLTAAQATQLEETWTLLGANIAAPVSFDAAALFVQALAASIDIAIGVVGTTVTLTRQP